MSTPSTLAAVAESALNRYLKLDPEALSKLAELEGNVIGLEFRGLGICFYLIPGPDGVQILSRYEGTPDTLIRGTPLSMAQLGFDSGGNEGLFTGDVEILGDTEKGQRFRAILDSMDVDWEELLSGASGDVVAHQLGNLARKTGNFIRYGANLLRQDISEYLQEEARLLPPRILIENFLDDVSELRLHVDRLEARIRRIEKTINSQNTGITR